MSSHFAHSARLAGNPLYPLNFFASEFTPSLVEGRLRVKAFPELC